MPDLRLPRSHFVRYITDMLAISIAKCIVCRLTKNADVAIFNLMLSFRKLYYGKYYYYLTTVDSR